MRVLYFAWLKDRLGCAEETVALPAAVGNVGALLDWMRARSPRHQEAFAEGSRIRAAVNQEFATDATRIAPGDEIAFFPPVTGG
ncbi:molybdopterin converting factor subunit 1 [Lichenicoccus sp.]|uniref:molybdopterin converting factor subunit 1 n=1 Tax=Lichenicoccus sp. TaxID=2781899 RepID=UPI003D0ED259